jgi:hypothetical protein
LVQAEVELKGWQVWQEFVPLSAPVATKAPPIQQPARQLAALQTFPPAQTVPSLASDQPVVDVPG